MIDVLENGIEIWFYENDIFFLWFKRIEIIFFKKEYFIMFIKIGKVFIWEYLWDFR